MAVHGHWPCPYTLLCTAKIRTFFKSKQYEQNFLISKEKATAISILSAVCWLVCAPCRLGQPSILPSSQPHVSNSKTSFTAVHGTGLTGLYSARRIHCNVILAHSVIFIHLGGQRDRSVSRRATRCSIYQDINLFLYLLMSLCHIYPQYAIKTIVEFLRLQLAI